MFVFVVISASAYETDQLTWRDHQLLDATPIANRAMVDVIADAVEAVNARTACAGTEDLLRDALAHEIHVATGRPTNVWSRGLLRAPGFGTFTAALETTDAVDRFAFANREDIYGAVGWWSSVILATAGPCSTFEIGGARIGSDKIDHFLDTGFAYYRAARRLDLKEAMTRGTATERSFYGMLTSKTFSYADLRANWDGYRFYASLLAPGSEVVRGADGCLAIDRAFDWRTWTHPGWDEVLNPPVYTRRVELAVLRGLDTRRTEICAARERWDPDGWRERTLASSPPPTYVLGPAPARRDPWQLAALCDPGRSTPLEAAPVRPRDELRDQRREARVPSTALRTVP